MTVLFSILIGYFIGALPFSYLVPKIMKGIDIRQVGSGNVGATNVYRAIGPVGGFFAFSGDILKGIVATWICMALWGETPGLIAGAFAMFGHCYSYLLGFKGGKGVTTAAGIVLIANPLIFMLVFVFQFAAIGTLKIVSLASILSAILFPILAILLKTSTPFILFSLAMSLFVIYRHRSNIERLLKFEEAKITSKKSR